MRDVDPYTEVAIWGTTFPRGGRPGTPSPVWSCISCDREFSTESAVTSHERDCSPPEIPASERMKIRHEREAG